MKELNYKDISEIKKRIDSLPKGSIVQKTIKGKIYFYHQYYENGKLISKYIHTEEIEDLRNQFVDKQELEKILASLSIGEDPNHLYCDLMHNDDKVVRLFINKNNGKIEKIGEVYNTYLLPIGTTDTNKNLNQFKFRDWWENRSIPLSRSGIKEAMELLEVDNLLALVVKCYGLSLSDQYWIKPITSDKSWNEINFFDNDFSNDIGNIIFRKKYPSRELDYDSPDSTSGGNLKKRWSIFDDKRLLIKGGSSPFKQEPINEVIAYEVAKVLEIPCIKYSLYDNNQEIQCYCEDFISNGEDLVSASQINNVLKKENNVSFYAHFINCCKSLNISNYQDFLNKMIVFDFIIANEDRHLNNFGFIREVNNAMEYRPAPIFDNGNSFGFDKVEDQIFAFDNIISKPFIKDIKKQLELVTDFSWLKMENLVNVKEVVESLFRKSESIYLSKNRIERIISSCFKRIDYLIELIK